MVATGAVAFLSALLLNARDHQAQARHDADVRANQEARWLAEVVAADMVRGDRSAATDRATAAIDGGLASGIVILDSDGSVFAAALSEDHPELVPSRSWQSFEGTIGVGRYRLAEASVRSADRVAGRVVVATQPARLDLAQELAVGSALLVLLGVLTWWSAPRLMPRRREPVVVEVAAQAKAQLLANTSHELRTPLNGIVGMADVLLASRLDDRQVEAVAIIKRSSATLLALIDQLLDFARVDAGELELAAESFDLLELVEDLCALQAPRAHTKGIRLIAHVSPEIEERVVGDPLRIRQVLTNLVGNALKFTATGEVRVGVSIDSETEETYTLMFRVDDTGIGIPSERLEDIFESFNQGDGSTTRRFGGTGLGLAISRRLVEGMGGRIGVQSAPGGSVFWCTIAIRKEPGCERTAVTRSIPAARVLLVDGCGKSRAVLRDYLDSWGLEVLESSDALGALTQLDRSDFDLVLVDSEVAGGAGVARAARRCLRLVPVGEADPLREDVLSRPVRRRQLRDRVAVLLLDEEQEEVLAPVYEFDVVAPRILVADDDPTNQLVVGRMLERLGCEVILVDDGQMAIDALIDGDFDLAFLDCLMPEHDGLAVARIARQRLGMVIPLIALTANTVSGNREACLDAGMTDFLAKPVTLDSLGAVVERWVGLPLVSVTASK